MPLDLDLILTCLQRAWVWRLGDNHVLGWSITLGYAAAAILGALVVWRAPFAVDTAARERAFWALITLCLVFLAINKQLNLQTTLRDVGSCVARAEGWYHSRSDLQRRFVVGLGWVLGALGVLTFYWLRTAMWRNLPAVMGCLLLAGFVVVRAADIGNVGRYLRWEVVQIAGPRWVEIAGIACLITGALWLLRRGAPRTRRI